MKDAAFPPERIREVVPAQRAGTPEEVDGNRARLW